MQFPSLTALQIDQLKEEIGAKESALIKEHSVYEEVEQQKVPLHHTTSPIPTPRRPSSRRSWTG